MTTFDGHKVDASFASACIHRGTGNCQKMFDSDQCSGFSSINDARIWRHGRKGVPYGGPKLPGRTVPSAAVRSQRSDAHEGDAQSDDGASIVVIDERAALQTPSA
jgi:hypothetical protein